MSIRKNRVYQYGTGGSRFRVLTVDEGSDLAVTVLMGKHNKRRLSARPKPQSLAQLREEVEIRKLVPVDLPATDIPTSLLKGKAKAWADKITEALQPLAETDPVELCKKPLAPRLREAAKKLGLTLNAVNFMFTKVMQAGMRLSAAFPRWDKCGPQPAVVDGRHCVAKPTKQPNSYPLSLAEVANIIRGAKEFLRGDATWSEAYDNYLDKFHAVGIRVVDNEQIVDVKPKGQRPSFGQFYRHARRHLGIVRRIILKIGKDMFLRNHAGKPIGQAFSAIMPGHEVEIDWTTTGLAVVRRGKRVSVGTLVVYVIVDVYTGEILSIYLTLGNCSVEEASRAILLCLEDKVELCKRYGITITAKKWPAKHLFVVLTSDRGELNSWKSSSLIKGLGIKLKMTRSKFARDKGTVESINAQIKRLMRRLAGGTTGKKERGEISPHAEAIYDFDQVYRMLLAFAVWHNAKLRADQPLTDAMVAEGLHKKPTPNALWDYADRHGMLREFDLAEARIHAIPFRAAAVTDRGIRIEDLRYEVPTLDPTKPGGIDAMQWLAEARKKRWKVDLGIDEATVDYVWLRHAPQGAVPQLIQCPLAVSLVSSYGGLSWPEYRSIKADSISSREEYREGEFREATAIYRAILKRTTKEAEDLTHTAREGMKKAQLLAGIDQNRSAEAAERNAAAIDRDTSIDEPEFEEDFGG